MTLIDVELHVEICDWWVNGTYEGHIYHFTTV